MHALVAVRESVPAKCWPLFASTDRVSHTSSLNLPARTTGLDGSHLAGILSPCRVGQIVAVQCVSGQYGAHVVLRGEGTRSGQPDRERLWESGNKGK